ncbi:MAG: diguanylate cyclase [Gammaproteobacteria bacterium]|nr:diguanylate cyclase [Gammaproteobacteria bacterium]MBU1491470.1 diguanylate cyclase [Gammaproteobacteria bacterium]MBU2066224.1 diguanylate cyclase [Gammaproteobacteria bacterium]MBU2139878.1 diguanylate cyclase [Gammaproteobacteria bacterium]MBU2215533.1 diguanylate cyclase [Gammaproteobacteria bacterium]
MSDDASRWKDKYLSSLEQQEKLERRWDARLDLLRRGLVRSSLAAEGVDRGVDQCMHELREILRRDDIDAGLSALIPRLEKAVLDSEQRRQERVGQVSGALSALVDQLLKLELPREVRKPLKQFAKQLDKRAEQVRELPALLAELSHLQAQALALSTAETAERPGLLERLFGSRDEREEPAVVVSEPEAPPPLSPSPQALASGADAPVPLPEPVSVVAVPERSAQVVRASSLDSLPLSARLLLPEPAEAVQAVEAQAVAEAESDPDYALPAAPEPGYSAIASHVEATLLGLLEELPLPAYHQPQADLLRARIQAGLNLYELVPVLDDLAVLMLAIADVGQREFEGYLKQLNERLASFQGGLQDAHEGYAESMNSARALDIELRQQVDGLNSSVQQATDLDSLKHLVEERLDGLIGTMSQYQRQRDQREQAVVERLQTLVERVASMEQEAKGFRDHLEEQRQKALLDPLTGLPNRAAWSERLDVEMARWQRYGGELLLAVLDIDHFKRINDDYGHLAGDKVLKILAGELAKRLRKSDFIARFGGEEFVLLIPSTPLEGGVQLLETLRESIERCPFHFKGVRVTITLSAGISAFTTGDRSTQVFERADQALYRAKRGGRNRVEHG